MQALHIRTTTTTTEAQQAAVAELMTATETPFARPSITMLGGPGQILLVSSPEPEDEPGDE